MKLNGLIYNLPGELRNLIILFVIVLSTGYFVGVMFIDHTSSLNPQGIQDNYLGNEVTERIDVIKFKKSSYQMFNLIHTHVISMSIIFFIMGLLLSITDLNKYFDILENWHNELRPSPTVRICIVSTFKI